MVFRVFGLWVLFTFLIGGAVAYGRTQQDLDGLPNLGFDTCDGNPCFMSVNLKEFNPDSLREKLVHLPNSSIDPESQWDHLISTHGITYLVQDYAGSLIVKPVKLDTRLNLGQFIEYYGEPCGLITTDPIPTIMLIYPGMIVYAAFSGAELQERLHQSTPIQRVEMANPVSKSAILGCNEMKWMGFAALSYYWDRGLVWPGD